jgi:hypothetical protein
MNHTKYTRHWFALWVCVFPTPSALFSGAPARACTMFCDSRGDTVFGGRSFDIPDNLKLTFVRVTNGEAARDIVNLNGTILSGGRISDKPAG